MNTKTRRNRVIAASTAGLALVGALAVSAEASANAAPAAGSSVSASGAAAADTETNDGSDGPQITGSVAAPKTSTEQSDAAEQQALQPLAKISKTQAMAAATATSTGSTATSAMLENADGYVVWGVNVKDAKGAVMDVKVDAGSGKVLATEPGDHEGAGDSEHGATEAPGTETNDGTGGTATPSG